MKKISTTTFVLLAGLFIIGSIYFLYLNNDENLTYSSGYGGTDTDYNILQQLSTISCTPSAGFDYCYLNKYDGLTAKIELTNWQGKSGYGYIDGAKRKYYIDEVYVETKISGDKLYVSKSSTWNSCDRSGCGGVQITPGKYVLASAPSKFILNTQFTAWNKYESYTSWKYVYASSGWMDGPYQYYVIDCYDDSDVPEGYFCDKSGSWGTWTEKIDPCFTMPQPRNICDGFDWWSQKCVNGEYVKDELIQHNSIICGCKIIKSPPNICVGYDLWSQKQTTPCVESLIKDQLIEANSNTCGYVCQAGDTQLITCTDGSTVTKSICENNKWITNNEYPEQSCPINWNNIDMILTSYLNQITTIVKGLLS